MKVTLNGVSGIDDAIVSMYLSKRSYTEELEENIRSTCDTVLNRRGFIRPDAPEEQLNQLNEWIDMITRIGKKHITVLRYIDFSVTVTGLHRGATDDFDSHAKRLENRIVRSSTRLSSHGYEMSDYYKDKIIPTDIALEKLGITIPEEIYVTDSMVYHGENIREISTNVPYKYDLYDVSYQSRSDTKYTAYHATKYVKAVNGYIREDLKDDNDVKRGLYMLSIPTIFEYKVNLTEYSHIYKLRGNMGGAHEELKTKIESLTDQIENAFHQFNRELLMKIEN